MNTEHDVHENLSTSYEQYNPIIKEFFEADFGYNKMGRCVISVRPSSEAERHGVKVGWLEMSVRKQRLSKDKKRRKKKAPSRLGTSRVQFLVPRRYIFYEVLCKAKASTHRKIEDPQRVVIGSVKPGTVRVMDRIKNRVLVACTKSVWYRDISGWLPKQQFAWLSIKAKDGTSILKPVSGQSRSRRSSLSSRASERQRPISDRSVWMSDTKMSLRAIQSIDCSRAHDSTWKPTIYLDFREKKFTKQCFSKYTPTPRFPIDSRECKSSLSQTNSTVSSILLEPKNSSRVFIDLDFEEIKNNHTFRNLIPLNFIEKTTLNEKFKSAEMAISVSETDSKVSLSRSRNLSDTYLPEAEAKYQHSVEIDNTGFPENRASISTSIDVKLSSNAYSESRSFIANNGELWRKSEFEENQYSLKNNLSVQVKELDLLVDNRSLRDGTLTPSSIESKHTNKSSEFSEQKYSNSEVEKESTPQEIEERRVTGRLAHGSESPLPFVCQPEDKSLNGRIIKHFRGQNVDQWDLQSERVFEPRSVGRRGSKVDSIIDSAMLTISAAEKSLECDNMNELPGFNFQIGSRGSKKRLICSADV